MKHMRKMLCVVLALLMAVSVGLVPAAYAAGDPAQEESLTWTKTTATLFGNMTYDMADICQFVLSPMDRSIPYANLAALEAAVAAKDVSRADMIDLLRDAITSIGRNPDHMRGADVLALTGKQMDDVAAYLFAGLKAKGVSVDKSFELESSKTVVYWALRVYDTGLLVTLSCTPAGAVAIDNEAQTIRTAASRAVTLTLAVNDPKSAAEPISFQTQIVDGGSVRSASLAWTKTSKSLVSGMTYKLTDVFDFALFPYDTALPIGRLATLSERIAEKKLDVVDDNTGYSAMQKLIEDAMTGIGSYSTMSGQDILRLTETDRRNLVTAIFNGLEAKGIEATAAQKAESSQTVLYWFMRAFDPDKFVDVHLSCSPDVAEYKSVYQTLAVKETESDRLFTLTLTAADAPSVSISFEVRIEGAFDSHVRSLAWKGAKRTVLVTRQTYKLEEIYSFVLSPFDHTYTYEDLAVVDRKIADKKLTRAFMTSLLSAAMTQIGKDLSQMTGSDVMELSLEEQTRAANYIFLCLKEAGADTNIDFTAYTKDARTVLYWMLRVYDTGRLVTLTTDADTIDIDNQAQTIRVLPVPIVKENETARLTLCANDPDPGCVPITMDVKVEEPLKLSHESLTLAYKEECNLLTASKEVTWSSSNEKVATVNEKGVIKAVGKGSAVITATREVSGEQLTCNVKVRYTFWQWLIIIFLFGWIWYLK